jgi:hypoxanthine phosphoribosyltransferase
VSELAAKISRTYKGKTLHIACIPDDCFVFIADLVRALQVPVVCHFVTARMSDAAVGGVPVREIRYVPRLDLGSKDVLLVSGIVYSGVTLDFLYRHILAQGPRSLRTASLIEKPEDRKVDVAADYLAFKSTDTAGEFLVGYGLGHQGLYRNLPCIAALAP